MLCRVFGDASQGLAEAAASWGATLECLVSGDHLRTDAGAAVGLPGEVPFDGALVSRPPPDPDLPGWHGIFLATATCPQDYARFQTLLWGWKPAVVVLLSLPDSPKEWRARVARWRRDRVLYP